MKNKLLVCIAFHYVKERKEYLTRVLNTLETYDVPMDIIIDTNKDFKIKGDNIKVHVHEKMEHPFHLTWFHRKHIKENINNYDVFMYLEDDMVLPFDNYLNYLENFQILYPRFVPSFVRIEERDWVEYISDIPTHQKLDIKTFGNKQFHAFPFPINYHAFWIMPQKELKESMKPDFDRLSDGREFAAMYVGWELQKPAMVEIENGQISKKCYSYHLPNNYALSDGHPNGKIKPENIFQ